MKTISLVAKIKEKAKKLDSDKEIKKNAEKSLYDDLNNQLTLLKVKTMEVLKPLNRAKSSRGTLKLITEPKDCWVGGEQYLAILELDQGKHIHPVKLLFVKDWIASGTMDYSDDVRDIPYTKAYVSFRNECIMSGDKDRANLKFLNEFASSEESLEKALEKLSDHLAPLFSAK